MSEPREPVTEAGRALDRWIGAGLRWVDPKFPDRMGDVPVSIHDDILEIERASAAAARADALAEIRTGVEGLARDRGDDDWDTVVRSEVLALLEPK